jgi:hypothetical protein
MPCAVAGVLFLMVFKVPNSLPLPFMDSPIAFGLIVRMGSIADDPTICSNLKHGMIHYFSGRFAGVNYYDSIRRCYAMVAKEAGDRSLCSRLISDSRFRMSDKEWCEFLFDNEEF